MQYLQRNHSLLSSHFISAPTILSHLANTPQFYRYFFSSLINLNKKPQTGNMRVRASRYLHLILQGVVFYIRPSSIVLLGNLILPLLQSNFFVNKKQKKKKPSSHSVEKFFSLCSACLNFISFCVFAYPVRHQLNPFRELS